MLSVQTRDELAADLAQAERRSEPVAPLTDGYPNIDVVDAYMSSVSTPADERFASPHVTGLLADR